MLGDSLLVAPIFNEEGLGHYYLPEGRWTHFLTGEIREGGRWYKEYYDYFSLPLFAREGSIIPMGAEDTRPDYDYEDGVIFRVFPTNENRHAQCRLIRADKSEGGVLKVEFVDGEVRYEYVPSPEGSGKTCEVRIG